MQEDYKLNQDYKVKFPYGPMAEPQIEILTGDYKGLKFDVLTSYILTDSKDHSNHSFNVKYKIINLCDDTSKTTINEQFFYDIVLNYVLTQKLKEL